MRRIWGRSRKAAMEVGKVPNIGTRTKAKTLSLGAGFGYAT